MDAITLLLQRRSCAALREPGPSDEDLAIILRAAIRVPDFQELRPYEFLVARDEGRCRLGALMEQAAVASGLPPEVIARAPKMPLRAPLVIVVVARLRESVVVQSFEQQLTAGCAVMAMQMAAIARGFGGIWRSGWPMFDANLAELLGLAEGDRIMGFLYLGTPVKPPAAPDDGDPARFVKWL